MDGVLVVDKPEGPTSHDVVAVARRALRERRIGHTGTLDPMATGVLPLVIGKATRLASMLSGAAKTYEATVRLGCATDTYDADGVVAGDTEDRQAASLTIPAPDVPREEVEAALGRFRGPFEQAPPPYSAKKIGGVAAYKLARQQREVSPKPVSVVVTGLELLDYAGGLATVRVTASAGFYVRSLAHDLGRALGCGGHLASLRRTRSGVFTLDDAVPLSDLLDGRQGAAERIVPMDRLLPDLPAARLTASGAKRAGHGNPVSPVDIAEPGPRGVRVRLLAPDGRLLGLGEPRPGGLLQPVVVLV